MSINTLQDKIDQRIQRQLTKLCDKLSRYTTKELKEIAMMYNIDMPCRYMKNKKQLCSYISLHMALDKLNMVAKNSLRECQKNLSVFQDTKFLQSLGEKKSQELLSILTQQFLWLLDRHNEYHMIQMIKNPKEKKAKMTMLIATIEGQCRQASQLFSAYAKKKELQEGWWPF